MRCLERLPALGGWWLGLLAVLCLMGCGPGTSKAPQPPNQPLAGTQLRLLVVDDPALTQRAARLRGEWQARSGCELEVGQMTSEELLAADQLPADVVVCPEWMLGPLAEKNHVQPVPEDLLAEDALEWSEVFDLVRFRVVQWGNRPVAVPLGSPVLVCYCRADLLDALGRDVPRTWEEYIELAAAMSDPDRLGLSTSGQKPWYGCIEPLGPGWAAIVLMARASPYVKHHNNVSDLFDIDTMEPLIDRPPWVRALEELVAAAKLGPAEQLEYDPAAVRRAFWEGRCGLALCWPSAGAQGSEEPDEEKPGTSENSSSRQAKIRLAPALLPGSREAFDYSGGSWEARSSDESMHVPLLSAAGRVGVVAAQTKNAQASWRLLEWLSGRTWSARFSPASGATTMFRRSHLAQPGVWVEPQMTPQNAAAYGRVVEQSLSGNSALFALRIPGRADYLAALDDAVRKAVRGELEPAEALKQAARRWQAITDRLGRERQRRAYLHSLGLAAL